MKKPSQKRDVFRASQKSFFLRSWSAPGQCPMTVFIFSRFFDFSSKMRKKEAKIIRGFAAFSPDSPPGYAPKSHRRRNVDFSWILHGFWGSFSSAAPRRGDERVKLLESSGIIRYLLPPYPPACPKNPSKIHPKSTQNDPK